MTSVSPKLQPGRVYRTRELTRWSSNPTRLASRLVRDGVLVRLRHGLYAAPRRGRFGVVPPSDDELLDALLGGRPWLVTGPPRWNALGLGAQAEFALPLVYNTERSGEVVLAGRRFLLRRVGFPEEPPAEWFVVDLFNNAEAAALSRDDLTRSLRRAVRAGRFDPEKLLTLARTYATRAVQDRVGAATA